MCYYHSPPDMSVYRSRCVGFPLRKSFIERPLKHATVCAEERLVLHLEKERRKTLQHSPKEILKDPDWFKHLFDAIFPIEQRLKFLSSPPSMDEDPYYVINKPSLRLADDRPLITTRIKDQENIILNSLNATPDERCKPLIVITKGKGGGKTRIIEEIKNIMNAKDDCLAIAVTFNHLTEINPSIDIFRGEDPMLSFALSIITRTISSVYKISHQSAKRF